ncbi:hypothetical protein Q0590_29110 [Rhodocytophaga aerolata]|uniref:Macroglobulin domain-containing protein n=1 Tax=Rhodocytophaga aerolata TaxID=455078 RepID=A0ABT8RHU4_9BACT|nr:hypothetical protein [Rhodocytophaga aerolata]MDO1450370.1 hypothetical protein [Rhodocytophaga aerolata]
MNQTILTRIHLIFFLMVSCAANLFSQTDASEEVVQKFNNYSRQALQEKLYIHTDQSVYLTGELLWFKVYYVDGTLHQPLDLSKVAYLEVLDQDQRPVLQAKVALSDGSGNGSFFLPASLNSGNYLIRGYTNWMKNFDKAYFFEKPVTIINTFRQIGALPVKDTLHYEVQFFPEGGNLVENIASKVAFRVTDHYGKGVGFKGVVLTAENDTVARFQPQKFGIGHFLFTPLPGNQYKAILRLANGKELIQKLPEIHSLGYTMQLEESAAGEINVTVQVASTTPLPHVYLLAHTRQQIKIAQKQALQQNTATFTFSKQVLGDGISHITIFNASNQPVCERLYFKRPEQKLVISAKADQEIHSSRKKVVLDISTQHTSGNPLAAQLSVAVYKTDTLLTGDNLTLPSYLWLSSDLAGKVESPDYYFTENGPHVQQELDNLMLTHGWRRFSWQQMMKGDRLSLKYIPEYEGHLVQGRIIHTTQNTPAANISAYLSVPGRYPQLYIAQSDSAGELLFAVKEVYGARQLIAQTNSQRDSLYRIELKLPYFETSSSWQLPYFSLAAQTTDALLTRSLSMQTQNTYFAGKRNHFTAFRPDTATFYGSPDARYHLDEYTRFPLIEDVLKEYVPGVQARKRRGNYYLEVLDLPHKINFTDNPLVVVDGVPVFDMNRLMSYNPFKVKRLDVVTRKYYLGPESFSGVLGFATFTGEVAGLPLDPGAVILDFEGLQQQREFYAPLYDTPQQQENRLPDFRHLLFWSPTVKTNKDGKTQLAFYTSDMEGEYTGVLEGITPDGKIGHSTFTITVQHPPK